MTPIKELQKNFKKISKSIKGFDSELNFSLAETDIISHPDLLSHLLDYTNDLIVFLNTEKELDSSIIFTLRIPQIFNKSYYIMAKLADNALSSQFDETTQCWVVTYNGAQIDELSITDWILYEIKRPELTDPRLSIYLCERTLINYVGNRLRSFVDDYLKTHISMPDDTVPRRIYNLVKKDFRQKLNDVYSVVLSEGRANIKWNKEYLLYRLFYSFVENVSYQYSPSWLSPQSIDIFLDDYNLGIEYQGEQHYSAVSMFGGEEGLQKTISRDLHKKELCMKNTVFLYEWKYDVPVNIDTVKDFLQEHGIVPSAIERKNESSQMAPYIPIPEKHVKSSRSYIVAYCQTGEKYKTYNTIREAAADVGISTTGISKVLQGEYNFSGGYIWKRYHEESEIPLKIPIENTERKKVSTGLSVRIAKVDEHGNILSEYDSIAEASRVTGHDSKTIRTWIKNSKGWIRLD